MIRSFKAMSCRTMNYVTYFRFVNFSTNTFALITMSTFPSGVWLVPSSVHGTVAVVLFDTVCSIVECSRWTLTSFFTLACITNWLLILACSWTGTCCFDHVRSTTWYTFTAFSCWIYHFLALWTTGYVTVHRALPPSSTTQASLASFFLDDSSSLVNFTIIDTRTSEVPLAITRNRIFFVPIWTLTLLSFFYSNATIRIVSK